MDCLCIQPMELCLLCNEPVHRSACPQYIGYVIADPRIAPVRHQQWSKAELTLDSIIIGHINCLHDKRPDLTELKAHVV